MICIILSTVRIHNELGVAPAILHMVLPSMLLYPITTVFSAHSFGVPLDWRFCLLETIVSTATQTEAPLAMWEIHLHDKLVATLRLLQLGRRLHAHPR
jgi:hypothetical protein